jgi:hypothetical protein
MTPAILACVLLLPPVAPGHPERPHELQRTVIKAAECAAYAPRYITDCAKAHADTIKAVRGRVVGECREAQR